MKGLCRANIVGITEKEIPKASDQLEGILEATEEATDQTLTLTETPKGRYRFNPVKSWILRKREKRYAEDTD